MESRRILSYALFVLGLVMLLILGLGLGEWLIGVLLGACFLLAGAIFYRRGK